MDLSIGVKLYLLSFLLFSGSGFALAETTPNLENEWHQLAVPKDLAMGLMHSSYDFGSLGDGQAELAMDSTHFKLPMGKYDFMDSFLVPTLSMEKTAFRFANAPIDNQEVYTLKIPLMFVTSSDDRSTRIVQITPSLHTDLDVIDEDAFSLMGLAVWRYQSTLVSAWTMGVGFNRLFGAYKPIPLVSYQYQVSSGLQFDLGFPITKAEYRWQNNWSTYASLAPIGGNWRYETDGKAKLNISYTSWVTAMGVRYQFKPKLWATFELGRSLGRKLNLDADERMSEDVDVADTPTIMFSVGFHP